MPLLLETKILIYSNCTHTVLIPDMRYWYAAMLQQKTKDLVRHKLREYSFTIAKTAV